MPTDPPKPPEAGSTGDGDQFDFAKPQKPGAPRDRTPKPQRVQTASTAWQRWVVEMLGDEEAEDFLSIPEQIRARINVGIRKSSPVAFSLCLHLAVLILLALMFVRLERERRQPIEISFAPTTVVEAEKPGVQIEEPEPEPVPEPDPEPEVMSDLPEVEEPIAVEEAVVAAPVTTPSSEPAAAAAPAIGALLNGREPGRRAALVGAYGGSDVTEAAVARALEWLARQQRKDGFWSLQGPYADGASAENRLAATAMALLAFQGAGNTPQTGIHKRAVASAWRALLKKQLPGTDDESVEERRRTGTGSFEIATQDPPTRQALYSHGQVTIALCELYGMTKDPDFETPARRAVAYALAAQAPNGGWRYEPGQHGDMSVTGWYMMALKSAQMAGLEVPEQAFDDIRRFLDEVQVEGGARYGYRFEKLAGPVDADDVNAVRSEAGPVTSAVSAEGLLCRQYLGWPRNHPKLATGVDLLLQEKFLGWEDDKDVYAWYYITQVAHHLGGPAWQQWNGRMRKVLPEVQVAKGRERGSWDPALDKWGPWGGRLFTTCFCTYMLEVYYRHLPLYGDEVLGE